MRFPKFLFQFLEAGFGLECSGGPLSQCLGQARLGLGKMIPAGSASRTFGCSGSISSADRDGYANRSRVFRSGPRRLANAGSGNLLVVCAAWGAGTARSSHRLSRWQRWPSFFRPMDAVVAPGPLESPGPAAAVQKAHQGPCAVFGGALFRLAKVGRRNVLAEVRSTGAGRLGGTHAGDNLA